MRKNVNCGCRRAVLFDRWYVVPTLSRRGSTPSFVPLSRRSSTASIPSEPHLFPACIFLLIHLLGGTAIRSSRAPVLTRRVLQVLVRPPEHWRLQRRIWQAGWEVRGTGGVKTSHSTGRAVREQALCLGRCCLERNTPMSSSGGSSAN